ncbi:hypothetical protein HBI25_190960 [Parastagonospora nodorum]|nr:hypothetical protein HBI10_009560 [Parastagonospora nodorum]KAH4023654.1 hypothetical protein HBI13_091270 [Parastagonospora nodorum]KAH4063500.1 hypothetical protein HBH50_190630 [Parastagonospora nodorum]KAH4083098.1 hypothetical protein HBH48_179370 [Parastagonospora nodorum]KAH4199092.1 hypothetical protein HBH42_052970 [Parastagonospora nodorum]
MPKSILVVAGTGKQGRATTRELLSHGHTVHILTRNPSSSPAKHLQSLGAVVHVGDLESIGTIQAALDNVDTVFLAIPAHPVTEVPHAKKFIEAAKSKNSFSGWSDEYPMAWYWKNKYTVENMIRTSGIAHWTILRPSAFMQNFCRPEVEFMFPGLADAHELRVAFDQDTKLDLLDVADIGKFAAAAIEAPAKYAGAEIAIAGERLTTAEMAQQLGKIRGVDIKAVYLDDEQVKALVAQGYIALEAQKWQKEVGYRVDVGALEWYGVPLTPLAEALDRDALGW